MLQPLRRVEAYYDLVPRMTSTPESIGPFTMFVARGGFPYYARPALDSNGPFTTGWIEEVRARQRQLGVQEAFEWVHEVTPGLLDAARAAGLEVQQHPLMVLTAAVEVVPPPEYHVRILSPMDPALPAVRAAIGVGFSVPGVSAGPAGTIERDAALAAGDPRLPFVRQMMTDGLLVMAAVEDEAGPVAGGSHSPRDGTTELTGIATLPSVRRQGLGAAIASALTVDALSAGAQLCFLSADSDDVARVYQRVGFTLAATACTAQPPGT